jgi:type IV pilus assembly protein PilC
MTTFAWVGRTRAGQMITGERAAESGDALAAALRREQIFVTKVTPNAVAKPKKERAKRVSAKSLAVFTRQFSVMIDAGLPLVQCLELLAKEEPDKRLAASIDEESIYADICVYRPDSERPDRHRRAHGRFG